MEKRHLNVLVADDKSGVRFLLETIVKKEGHKCFLASNGLEAVNLFKELKPDLVFMNVVMPGLDGLSALKIMDKDSFKSNIVLMTVYPDNEVQTHTYTKQPVQIIVKPFEIEEVRRLINQVADTGTFRKAI